MGCSGGCLGILAALTPIGVLGTLILPGAAAGAPPGVCPTCHYAPGPNPVVAYAGLASFGLALVGSLLAAVGATSGSLAAATRLLGIATGLLTIAFVLFAVPGAISLGAAPILVVAFFMLPATVVLFIAFQRGRSLKKSAGASTVSPGH